MRCWPPPQAILGSPFGCGTKPGFANMAAYCRASCGAYCMTHKCLSKSGKTNYAAYYCIASGSAGSCFDSTQIDYACPHHSFGTHVPSQCNSAHSVDDDECASVYTAWWKRCAPSLTPHVPKSVAEELALFNVKCQSKSGTRQALVRRPRRLSYCLKSECASSVRDWRHRID